MCSYIVTILLSCFFTLTMSLMYMAFTGLMIEMRYSCNVADLVPSSSYFLKLLYKQYIEDIFCPGATKISELTAARTVFHLLVMSMIFTCINIIACLLLTLTIVLQAGDKLIQLATYMYTSFYLNTVILDITISSFFARDYLKLTEDLDQRILGQESNYMLDLTRIGALLITIVALKGIVFHVVNFMLILISLITLPKYLRRRRSRGSFPQPYMPKHVRPSASTAFDETLRAIRTEAALDHVAHVNSVDDLPRFRRLQSTRTRRASGATHQDSPVRRLRFEVSPSPSPPPPPPPRPPRSALLPLHCTCGYHTAVVPMSRAPRAPRAPCALPITTTAVVEAVVETTEMAVAGPSGSPHSSYSHLSNQQATTEL